MERKTGVAISTHNRPANIVDNVLYQWDTILKSIGNDYVIVVVDDASNIPYKKATYRFNRNVGIAASKNKCIQLLYDLDCTDFFLSDDDVFPLNPKGITNYLETPFAHLCLSFNKGETKPIGQYAGHNIYDHINGCLLYLTRDVIDTVGGMRPEFGRWANEHLEYSNRIYNAGLTPYPYMDVPNNIINFYSYDYYGTIQGSVPEYIRRQMSVRNSELLKTYKDTKDYVDFKQL
jgi:hypothetical protein